MNAVQQVQIKSDVVNRLKKIREGVVYDNVLTFLYELIQNGQRAKATRIDIEINSNYIKIKDNGIGCKNPNDLFTLDVSGFGIGFGEGFSSIYTIADSFRVETLNWLAEVDVNEVLRNKNLDVEITLQDFYQGFIVTLYGEKVSQYQSSMIEQAQKIASIIPDIDFYVNEEKVYKEDLLKVPYGVDYHDLFENRIYTGRLVLSDYSNGIDIYYDYRYVTKLYSVTGLEGTIIIKPNKINLKAPDRKSIIYDDKRTALIEQLEKDIHVLLVEVLKKGNSSDIKKYAEIIRHYLPVSKFMKYLNIDERTIQNQYETREKAERKKLWKLGILKNNSPMDETVKSSIENGNEENRDEENQHEETEVYNNDKDYTWNQTEDTNYASAPIRDFKRKEENQRFSSFVSGERHETISKSDLSKINISNIKRKSNVIWIEKDRVEDRQDLIAKYEYYGVFTFVSPHCLYDDALRYLGITHIDEMEEQAIEKQYDVKNTGAKTLKEQRTMEILTWLEEKLGLQKTFYLSDINCKLIVSLNEKRIHQEKLDVHGYCENNTIIHLDRKSLKFGKLNSTMVGKKQFGIHDVKFILANLQLISHELSHVYGSKDNTIAHYHIQDQLQNKIGKFVLEAEELF